MIDLSKQCSWSKENILELIKKYPNSRTAPYKLVSSAIRYFGSWALAKKEVNIPIFHSGISRAISIPLTKEAGYVIGALIGDGWVTTRKEKKGYYRIGFSVKNKDKEFIDEFLRCWNNWIMYKPLVYYRKDNDMWVIQKNSKELYFLILSYKEDAIRCLILPQNVQDGIILGLLDAEGYVRIRSENDIEVLICNMNKKVLDFIEQFMKNNNIECRKHERNVSIRGRAILDFIEKVGLPIIQRKRRMEIIRCNYGKGICKYELCKKEFLKNKRFQIFCSEKCKVKNRWLYHWKCDKLASEAVKGEKDV